jgi:hypothetical protein
MCYYTDLILEWAAHNPKFDTSFVEAMAATDYRSPRMEEALQNIVDRFRIEEWHTKQLEEAARWEEARRLILGDDQ